MFIRSKCHLVYATKLMIDHEHIYIYICYRWNLVFYLKPINATEIYFRKKKKKEWKKIAIDCAECTECTKTTAAEKTVQAANIEKNHPQVCKSNMSYLVVLDSIAYTHHTQFALALKSLTVVILYGIHNYILLIYSLSLFFFFHYEYSIMDSCAWCYYRILYFENQR